MAFWPGSNMRRVVITGLGMVSPLACGVEPTWRRLLAGESGARVIDGFDTSDLSCKIAMPVPRGGAEAFDPDDWMEPKEQRKVDDFILYAIAAATQALADAGWKPESYQDQIETGVLIGSGIGGLGGIAETAVILHEKGPRRVSPFFHSRPADQSGRRLCLHTARSARPKSCGRHGLLDRRACDRRRGASDRARRRRGHGRWRRQIADQPYRHRRIRRLPRPVHRLQ